MDFTYEADGRIQVQGSGSESSTPNHAHAGTDGVLVGGCAGIEFIIFVRHKFSIGDIVYDRKKALKGIMRRYTIKEVRVFPFEYDVFGSRVNRKSSYPFPPLYVDTYNAFHNEEDLLSFTEALAIAQDAIDAEEAAQEEFIRKNCG